ncbi:MAG: RNA methyltransferase, partial [Bdellovibrionales bacterium]|nr:RNA methyltransferase [Bdellovibrionales bacterium]
MATHEAVRPRVAVGLVHWPVVDKLGKIVTTNVTNFDIHDIARASRTYGVEQYYIINKLESQLMFVHRVMDHWRMGEGASYNAKRKEALSMVKTAKTLEEAIADWGCDPTVIATGAKARQGERSLGYGELREELKSGKPHFLVFGT